MLNPLLSSSLRVKSTKLRTTPVSDVFFEVVAFLEVVTLVVFFEVVTSVVSFEEAASLEVVSGSADFLLRVLRVLPATLVEVESSVVDLVSF